METFYKSFERSQRKLFTKASDILYKNVLRVFWEYCELELCWNMVRVVSRVAQAYPKYLYPPLWYQTPVVVGPNPLHPHRPSTITTTLHCITRWLDGWTDRTTTYLTLPTYLPSGSHPWRPTKEWGHNPKMPPVWRQFCCLTILQKQIPVPRCVRATTKEKKEK